MLVRSGVGAVVWMKGEGQNLFRKVFIFFRPDQNVCQTGQEGWQRVKRLSVCWSGGGGAAGTAGAIF